MDYAAIYPFWADLSQSEKESIENACYTETYEKGMLMLTRRGTAKA